MGVPLPPIIIEYTKANWAKEGMNAIYVYRLIADKGRTHCQINAAMNFFVGYDWMDVRTDEWIDRLAKNENFVFGLMVRRSLDVDSPPLLDCLDTMIEEYLQYYGNPWPCGQCKEIHGE